MDAAGGHGGVLAMPSQMARKEWRVVSEGSGRERSGAAENPNDHSGRVNNNASSGRIRVSHGAVGQNFRNGPIFHLVGGDGGEADDSDHHTSDLGEPHGMDGSISPHELAHQSLSEDDDARLYEEIQRVQQEEHLDSSMDPLSLENIRLNSSMNSPDLLQHRLHEIIRQREQLQHIELELRAQFIASSEILRLQNGFDEQAKQHAEIVANLQEEAQERDHRIHDLEQQLEERERQLSANQLEADEAVSQVWAKDDLLREQTSEIGNLRRERDNAVAENKSAVAQLERERAQNLAQLQDLKEQVQQKERQVQEYEEQCRSTQDALMFKDEQLREAQLWMQRAQELDAYHANANNSLHAELRERTDQMNHLWLGYQRQMAEAERFHAQVLQKLQVEVSELKEQNRQLRSAASTNRVEIKDDRTRWQDAKETDRLNDQSAAPNSKVTSTSASIHVKPNISSNGTADGYQSAGIQRDTPLKVEHATGLPVGANPVLGMARVLPPGPAPVMHQLQQVIVPSLQPSPMQIPQPPLGQFQPVQAIIQTQYTSGAQQTVQHHLNHSQQHQPSQAQRFSRQPQHHLNNQFNPKIQTSSQPFSIVNQTGQEHASIQKDQPVMHLPQPSNSHSMVHSDVQQSVHLTSIPKSVLHQQNHFTEQATSSPPQPVQVDQPDQNPLPKLIDKPAAEERQQETCLQFHEQSEGQVQTLDQQCFSQSFSQQHSSQQQPQVQLLQGDVIKQVSFQSVSSSSMEQLSTEQQTPTSAIESLDHQYSDSFHPGKQVPNLQDIQNSTQAIQQLNAADGGSKGTESVLLDERSLLSCLVRVIPAESSLRVRISTTLPNRLGKMLAPLHWHDYKKQYGRLVDFVNSHHELFVIEGDFIHLREGAHALVSATTAVAKAAAALAAASSIEPNWSSVTVTPVAQTHMQRQRNSKGVNLPQNTHKHGQNSSPQVNALPQKGNGNTQSHQGSKIRSPVVHENGNAEEKSDEQQVVTVFGLRPIRVVSSSSSTREDSGKAMMNGLGVSGSSGGGSNSYHGNQQPGRNVVGQFGKHDFISRLQTQESSISVASAATAH